MKYFILAFAFLIPLNALAASAGTDEYLRDIGFTDVQLSTPVMTEDREAFKAAEGAGRVTDPAGDIIDRMGITSKIGAAWADIAETSLLKDETAQTWNVTVTFNDEVPDVPSEQNQLFLLVDADGNAANNDMDGYRIGMDAEFSVLHTQEEGWHANFRWYNKDADFWAKNKETTAAFAVEGNTVTLRIPFSEVSGTITPRWRAVMALANGTDTQIDVVPGTGFPPPKGETYPEPQTSTFIFSSLSAWLGWTAFFIAIGVVANRIVAKKRQK